MQNQAKQRPLALITGASSGIGYELAKEFARKGFDLIVAAADNGIVEAKQAFETFDVFVRAIRVDLATSDGVDTLLDLVEATGRPLDAAALNAGVGIRGDASRTPDLKEELDLIRVNVISPVHLTQQLIPMLIEQGHGRILLTASIAVTAPGPRFAVVAASNAFIQSFAEALRSELSDACVTITSLMPGPTGAAEKEASENVAREGFAALMAGKDHVTFGSLKNEVRGLAAKLVGEPTAARRPGRETGRGLADNA